MLRSEITYQFNTVDELVEKCIYYSSPIPIVSDENFTYQERCKHVAYNCDHELLRILKSETNTLSKHDLIIIRYLTEMKFPGLTHLTILNEYKNRKQ